MPYSTLEELVGKLAFAAQTHRLVKVYLTYIYDCLVECRPPTYPKGTDTWHVSMTKVRPTLLHIARLL